MERFGVECPLQNEEVKQKIRNTCIERYGVEHPMQVPEIADKCSKSAFTKKNYTLPSGKILQIQGYEQLKLNQHGQQKRKRIIYFLNKNQERHLVISMMVKVIKLNVMFNPI